MRLAFWFKGERLLLLVSHIANYVTQSLNVENHLPLVLGYSYSSPED